MVYFGLNRTRMYDEQMTAAMIDRLIHHSYLLIFDGQSYRMKQSLMRQLS